MSTHKEISKKVKKLSKSLKKRVHAPVKELSLKVNPDDLIPTGSCTLNLECSGRIEGAFQKGTMVNIIGDSASGKSIFALTIFAECNKLKRFDNYKFYYNDVEAANAFNLEYLFGKKCASRIDENTRSNTIEEFNDDLANKLKQKDPFIYVLDSFDALTSEAAIKKDDSNRVKREKGNKVDGSYGDGKPKKSSELFSLRIQELQRHGSLLIIISQTRDNIGFGAMFTPKTRSGGRALKFYAFHEIWLAMQKKEKEGKRMFKTNVQAKLTKNKLTGRLGESFFSILFDYGIDDISSCINFLIEEGNWTGNKKSVNTQGFMPKITEQKKKETRERHPKMSELISFIEEENKEEALYLECQKTYDEVMQKLKPKRKKKYT